MTTNQAGKEQKRIQLSVRMTVLVTVDASFNGDVQIDSVVSIKGTPSPAEVLEALDADGELAQLDEAFVAAGGKID